MKRFVLALACVVIGAFFAVQVRAGDEPPVFDKRPYAEAKQAAHDAKKWFIVKTTATWCGPCRMMDKTTWRDEKVVKWLETNAVIVAVDVDQEKDLAKGFGVSAIPTMIAFKEGSDEFDRVVGYRPPDEMLAWLEGIAKGEKAIEAIKKRADAPPGEHADMQAKMQLARSLTESREFVKAGEAYVWLWKNMLAQEPAMYGVRLSFMAGDMQRLAQQSKEAREMFVSLRDETGKRLEGEKVDVDDAVDWVTLNNRVLDDSQATLKWFDKVKDAPRWKPVLHRVERDLSEVLIEHGRWADVGRLASEPLADLESDWNLMQMTSVDRDLPADLDAETKKMILDYPKKTFRESAAKRYAGLLAAGREELASRLAVNAREHDPSPAMVRTLVSTALQADQAREIQLTWIEQAKDATLDDLAKDLSNALAKKQGPK